MHVKWTLQYKVINFLQKTNHLQFSTVRRIPLMDSQFENALTNLNGIQVRRLARPCKASLSLFWLYVWFRCLIKMSIFSPDSFFWPIRLNSSLICPGTLLYSCFLWWRAMPQNNMRKSIFKSRCSHLCTSLFLGSFEQTLLSPNVTSWIYYQRGIFLFHLTRVYCSNMLSFVKKANVSLCLFLAVEFCVCVCGGVFIILCSLCKGCFCSY